MAAETIYLDNNSTTLLHPQVLEAMTRCWSDNGANPASQHQLGRKARRNLEEAREGIGHLLGAKMGGMDADTVLFTSGGTEANNLALLGLGRRSTQLLSEGRVVISPLEHPSIAAAAAWLRSQGAEIQLLKAASHGRVLVDSLLPFLEAHAADSQLRLISLMLANNETGVLQPVSEIVALAETHQIPVHTDAVQAVGKIPVHFRNLGVSALTVTPHKFHGPLGIGALLVKHGISLQPHQFGGFQQAGLRPGTECLPLAIGFFTALVVWEREATEREQALRQLREQLETGLLAGDPAAVLIGQESDRLPTTVNIAFPGLNRQALLMALDLHGIACSTGSACASGSSEPSPTLLAMGLPKAVVEGSVRLSLSALTAPAQVSEATRRILLCVNDLRRRNIGQKSPS